MIFYIYNRWGDQIGSLQDVLSAVHTDELNGEDSLKLRFIGDQLIKGQRIVWRDKFNVWHEHTVVDLMLTHTSSGDPIVDAYCENSICELLSDYVVEKQPTGTATFLLNQALLNSRWVTGTVNVTGNFSTSWYHISAYEAIQDIVAVTGGELSTSITLSGSSVITRSINLQLQRGSTTEKRFTFGKNLVGLNREVEADEIYTALYGYGKGIAKYDDNGNATGGYSRKITFGSVNGGQDWVGDDSARLIWGLPDGKGGVKHSYGKVEFSDCEDPAELLKLTKAALKETSKPTVTYTGTVVNLAKAGFVNGEDSQTGDLVFIRDKILDEKLSGRVLRVERDLLTEANTSITLGNISSTLTKKIQDQQAQLSMLKNRSANWDGASNANQAWLESMMKNLNSFMDQEGGYVELTADQGITVYNKPKDQNPTSAIQLNGAGFRIANSKLSNGNWNWRTFGTGAGFTADVINTGKIQCGTNVINLSDGTVTLDNGMITDKLGRNTWDLAKGTLKTNYMEATNITATGSMTTGNTYRMVLANGSLTGYYGDVQVIQFDSNLRFTDGRYGGRITFPQYLVLRGPDLAVDDSTTGNGTIGGTHTQSICTRFESGSNGNFSIYEGTMKFTNGFFMSGTS